MDKLTKILIWVCIVLGFLAIAITITMAQIKKISSPEYLDELLTEAKKVQDQAYEQIEKNNQLLSISYVSGVVTRKANYIYNVYRDQGCPPEFEKKMIELFCGWNNYIDLYDIEPITDPEFIQDSEKLNLNHVYWCAKNFFNEKTQKLLDDYYKKVKEEGNER